MRPLFVLTCGHCAGTVRIDRAIARFTQADLDLDSSPRQVPKNKSLIAALVSRGCDQTC